MSKWGEDEVSSGFDGENVERFRVEDGKKDLIRIISDPVRYYSHSMKVPPYYITCRKEEGECPACNEGITRKQRVGCLIIHIGRKNARVGGEFQRIGLVKPWLFAKDRWYDIMDIMDNDPSLKKKGALKKIDLIVTCKDEQFQDMRISQTGQPSKMTKDMAGNLQEAKDQLDFYTSGMPTEKQLEVLGKDAEDSEVESLADIDVGDDDDVPFDVPILDDSDDETEEVVEEESTDDEVDDIMAELEEDEK